MVSITSTDGRDLAASECVSKYRYARLQMNVKDRDWCGSPRPGTLAIAQGLLVPILFLLAAFVSPSQASNQSGRFEHGFSYSHDEDKTVPWSIHVLKVERARNDLEFQTTLGQGLTLGMGLVSDQARALPAKLGKPLAAINGDFYRTSKNYAGDPEGLQIIDGELVSAPMPTRVCLWIDAA